MVIKKRKLKVKLTWIVLLVLSMLCYFPAKAQTQRVFAKPFLTADDANTINTLVYIPVRNELIFSWIKYHTIDDVDTSEFYALDSSLYRLMRLDMNNFQMDTLEFNNSLDSVALLWDEYVNYADGKYWTTYSKNDFETNFDKTWKYRYAHPFLLSLDSNFKRINEVPLQGLDTQFMQVTMNHLFKDSILYQVLIDVPSSLYNADWYLARFNRNTGVLLDTLKLEQNFFPTWSNYVAAMEWYDDSTIVLHGNFVYHININTMQITDTFVNKSSGSANLDQRVIYNHSDKSMYHMGLVQGEIRISRQDAFGINRTYAIVPHAQYSAEIGPRKSYWRFSSDMHSPEYFYYTLYSNYDTAKIGVYCVDSIGNVRWSKIFIGDSLRVDLPGVVATADSGVVVFFVRHDGSDINQRSNKETWMLHMDKNGNSLIPPPLSTEKHLSVTLRDNLVLYPNPSSTHISLANQNLLSKAESLEIYSLEGRRLLHQEFQQEIDISQLPTGQYIYRLRLDNGEVLSQKFVKE